LPSSYAEQTTVSISRKDAAIVPTTPEHSTPVTPEEFKALLKLAGLNVSDERAPEVLAELNVQLANTRIVDEVLDGDEPPTGATFDPAFPEIRNKDKAE
jgi:hypothetical protein